MINKFTRPILKELSAEIERVVRNHVRINGEQPNLHFECGSIQYSDKSFKVKLEVSVIDEQGIPSCEKAQAYKRGDHHNNTGFALGDLFFHERDKDTVYHMIGFNSRAKKYPYVIEEINTDKRRKCNASFFMNCYSKNINDLV